MQTLKLVALTTKKRTRLKVVADRPESINNQLVGGGIMRLPRNSLTIISAAVLLPSLLAQTGSQPSVNIPRTMHLCGAGFCQTLTWNDGHYDSRVDGQTEVGSLVAIVKWDRESVEFVGIVPKPDQAGSYITGIFTGNISSGGGSIDNGTDTWRAGIATGTLPFTMTWNPSDLVKTTTPHERANLPKSLRLCAGKCVALKLNDGNYDAYEENDPSTKTATYLVSSFSKDSVFLQLIVPNGLRAIVTGKVQGDGVVEGKLTWLNGFNGATSPIKIAWGDKPAAPQATQSMAANNPVSKEQERCYAIEDAEVQTQFSQPENILKKDALQTLKGGRARFNLNGFWTSEICTHNGGNLVLTRYRIVLDQRQIKIYASRPGWVHDGELFFEGTFTASDTAEGRSALNQEMSNDKWDLRPDTLKIINPDRIRFGDNQFSLLRLSPPGIDDAPCDQDNTAQVESSFAHNRGIEAITFREDYKAAACWFRTAALKSTTGYPQGLLGFLYYEGKGVSQDYGQAYEWAVKSASLNNSIGHSLLYLIYSTGNGAPMNREFARGQLLILQSQPRSLTDLAWTSHTLMGVDPLTPLEETGTLPVSLMTKAEKERNSAKVVTSDCLAPSANDLPVEVQWRNAQIAFGAKDFPLTACWAFLAGEQGNTDAQVTLGWFFVQGLGVTARRMGAVYWLTKAAKHGNPWAEAYLGNIYFYYRRDLAGSQYWFQKATAQPGGDVIAQAVKNDMRVKGTEDLLRGAMTQLFQLIDDAISDSEAGRDAVEDAGGNTSGHHSLGEQEYLDRIRKKGEEQNEEERLKRQAEASRQPTRYEELQAEFADIKSRLRR